MKTASVTGPVERIVGRQQDEDEPCVIGSGCSPSPMPTPEERWMAGYVARMVEQGIHADYAWLHVRAGENDYTSDPRDAADDDMSIWTDDGDG